MYLSGAQVSLLGQIMKALAEPREPEQAAQLRIEVGGLVMDLLKAQFYASFVWQPGGQAFSGGVQLNMDPGNLARYVDYYQFHDPITPLMQRYQVAIRASEVLAQPALMQTEFFNDFLARDGLFWGVNVYAWQGGRNIGDMRIWRDKRRENFSVDDLQLLDMILPTYVAALDRLARPAATLLCRGPDAVTLSPREQETALLVARGWPDKAIARQMGVSITTVRTHLERAFRKLGLGNRTELALWAGGERPHSRG